MVLFAINLMLITALFFISGMIKPKWPLFFLEKPTRFLVFSITLVLVMASFTFYGEGNRRHTEELALAAKKSVPKSQTIAPVPEPLKP